MPYWEATRVGPIEPWGFFVALGVVIGILHAHKRSKSQGLSPDTMGSLATWILVGGFLGARLFHVFVYHWADYKDNLGEIIAMWKGGMSSYGGFIGSAIGAVAYLRRSRLDFWHYADVASFAFIPAWTIGRIGCFLIHDHPGALSDFPLAVAMNVSVVENGELIERIQARHDLGLYDGILTLGIAALFFLADRRPRFHGFYLGWMCALYAVPRFFLDSLRAVDIDHSDTRYLGLTPAQYGSIILALLGGWILWTRRNASRTVSP